MNRRIGILGGSFNPIHEGHIYIAQQAKKHLQLDEIMLIPAKKSPLKDEIMTTFADRYAMCQLAIEGLDGFSVSDIEQHLPSPSYTINTIRELKKQMAKETIIFFLIGDDQANQLDQWKYIDELAMLVTFGVFVRHDKEVECRYNHVLIPADVHQASSTRIRQGYFVHLHPSVRQYILTHELYLDDIIKQRLPEKRYRHTISVRDTAIKIGQIHHLDINKLSIASYLHDIAKYISKEEMANYMAKESAEANQWPYPVHHQFASAQIAQEQLMITDPDILKAICNHTTGGDDPYSKVLFIADKIEPLRNYDVSQEWELLTKDLNQAYNLVKARQMEYIKGE